MFQWMLENSLVVLALSAVAVPLCALIRSKPAICHVLWLVILVRLVLPPVPLESPAVVRGLVNSATGRLTALVGESVSFGGSPGRDALEASAIDPMALKPTGLGSAQPAGATEPIPAGTAAATSGNLGFLSLDGVRIGALCLWIAGGLTVLLIQIRRCRRLTRLVTDANNAAPPLRRTVSYMANVLGVEAPDVRLLEGLGSPVVWSLGRPVFLWPAAGARATASRCIKGIVAHELAHIRRRDHWVAWFELAAMAVCWWNPVFWFVRRRLRLHAEEACDAWAVWALPGSRRDYAEALIDVAERRVHPIPRAPVLGVTESEPRDFQKRLSLIMERDVSHRASPIAAGLAMAAAVILLPGAGTAKTPEADSPTASDDSLSAPAPETTPWPGIPARLLPAVESRQQALSAAAHSRDGRWVEAASLYRRMAEAQPDDGWVLRNLGHALLESGRDDEALEVFQRQLEMGVERADAEARIASIHAGRSDIEAARTHLAAAVRAGFTDIEWLASDERLESLRSDGRLADVVEQAHRSAVLMKEGEAATKKQHWPEAVAAFREARVLRPQDGLVTLMLAYTLFGVGGHEEAIRVCSEQVELGFAVPIAHFNTACALSRLGRLESSMDALETAIDSGFEDWGKLSTDPDLEALRTTPRMQELLVEVARRSALWTAADEAQEAGHWDSAVSNWRSLVEHARPGGSERLHLGMSLLETGEPETAAGVLEEFVVHGGKGMNEALYQLARAHAMSGDNALALAYLEWAASTGFADAERLQSDALLAELRVSRRYDDMLQVVQERGRTESRPATGTKA